MPLPKSNQPKITCRVEEMLSNFILVSYRSGSKVFRGVLIDERCSQVRRVISPHFYPAKKKLKPQKLLFNSKPHSQAKVRCQSLRSHVPEPNCVILDNIDFIETGKSPIDSIKGLVDRIDHDLIVPPSSAVTYITRNCRATNSSFGQDSSKVSTKDNSLAVGSRKKRRKECSADNSSSTEENPPESADASSKQSSAASLVQVIATNPSPENGLSFDKNAKPTRPMRGVERLVVEKPKADVNFLPLDQLTPDSSTHEDVEGKLDAIIDVQTIDINDNTLGSSVRNQVAGSPLPIANKALNSSSLFINAPTETLRERLAKERNKGCDGKGFSSKLPESKPLTGSRVHNTRFKGSKSVISLPAKVNGKSGATKRPQKTSKDRPEEICDPAKGEQKIGKLADETYNEEGVKLVGSPLLQLQADRTLSANNPEDNAVLYKGSRKRKATALDNSNDTDVTPTAGKIAPLSNTLPSAENFDDNSHSLSLKASHTKAPSAGKKLRFNAFRDKEMTAFRSSQISKSIPVYAKPQSTEHGIAPDIDVPMFAIGNVVWGKVHGHPWWPGQVLSICTAKHSKDPMQRKYEVSWYGSTTVSVMEAKHLLSFSSNFNSKIRKRRYGLYRVAVKQAMTACKLRD